MCVRKFPEILIRWYNISNLKLNRVYKHDYIGTNIKQFEFGEKRVPAEILLKICQMFEIKPVDIFADLGTKPH